MNNYSQEGTGSLSNVVDFMAYKRSKSRPTEVLKKYCDLFNRFSNRKNTVSDMSSLQEERVQLDQLLCDAVRSISPVTSDLGEQLMLKGAALRQGMYKKKGNATDNDLYRHMIWKGEVLRWGEGSLSQVVAF